MTVRQEPTARSGARVVDVAVHPNTRNANDLRGYMAKPYASMVMPGPLRSLFPVPTGHPIGGAFLAESRTVDDTEATYWRLPDLPASEPADMRAVLEDHGTSDAVLAPLTRGVLPNRGLGSEIAAGTNEWLASAWLDDPSLGFWGSIRVNTADPDRACREIVRWATHPRMVQVAASLESHRPYGQPEYTRIWETAAEHGLPVAFYADGGTSVQYPPTANGLPGSFSEFSVMYPMNAFYHLMSFIAEGVLDRIPELRIVFGDGAFETLMPLMLRADMDWPGSKHEVPWVKRAPSAYLERQVRFVASRFDRPPTELVTDWFERADAGRLLLYGSRYPQWHTLRPDEFLPEVLGPQRDLVLCGNALDLFPRLT